MNKNGARQNLLIFLCWALYTSAYFGRYSYNSNINLIMSDYGVDHATAGLVTTFFFFGYGAGQFINGMLCEKYNKHILFPTVLISSAVINLTVYFDIIPFGWIKYMWLVNAFLQSCLWPSIILTVSQYLDDQHRKKALVVLSTTTAIGTFLTYLTSAAFVRLRNFRLSFLFGATLMITMAVIWMLCSATVKALPVQASQKEESDAPQEGKSGKRSTTVILTLIALCIFAVVHNFIKDGLQTWIPSILKETQSMDDSLSILLSLALPLLGTFGAISALALEKKIHNLVLLCMAYIGAAVPLIWLVMKQLDRSLIVSLVSFGVVVLAMHAVNNIVTGMAPLQLRDSFNSGRIAGIMNACCYIGSTISSYSLGAVADSYGWNTVLVVFLAVAVTAVVLGGVYALTTRRVTK